MAKNNKIISLAILVLVGIILIITIYLVFVNNKNSKTVSLAVSSTTVPSTTITPTPTPSVTMPTPTATSAKPTKAISPPTTSSWPITYNNSEASSITVVVNKKHKLPSTYVPSGLSSYGNVQLRSEAAGALTSLLNSAATQGYNLKTISGYRSYSNQNSTYNSYVSRDGQALADTYSARPGHSEHQTGLAVDVGLNSGSCDLETCFGDSPAGKWLAANAQNFGFIIRYPSGRQSDTGYQYEPWHLRYLGVDTAKAVAASGKTLDQYYNVEAGGY